jgi:hypothetical protein
MPPCYLNPSRFIAPAGRLNFEPSGKQPFLRAAQIRTAPMPFSRACPPPQNRTHERKKRGAHFPTRSRGKRPGAAGEAGVPSRAGDHRPDPHPLARCAWPDVSPRPPGPCVRWRPAGYKSGPAPTSSSSFFSLIRIPRQAGRRGGQEDRRPSRAGARDGNGTGPQNLRSFLPARPCPSTRRSCRPRPTSALSSSR